MSDQEIVEAFQQNQDRDALFAEIMRRYSERLYFHIRKIVVDHDDTDDALQNTLIRVWQNLPGFRGESQLFSWMYRIATNEALTVLRKRKPSLDLDDAMPELAQLVDSGAHISGGEIERKLQMAMARLPLKQKLVFSLRYFEDLSYEQIAEVTDTSIGALKASYFHAVNKLELWLKRSF
ncbi:MAG: sigma-70 family RNA polymerase sigma factor [Bacteroidetes bacterium]|nr:sigma-70 family RNA polymerase sigma factor [Bacteroidota bacterium]